MRSILELQGEIARAIVGEIRPMLAPSASVVRSAPTAVNPEAHEAYLRGRHALRGETEERRGRARELFEQAIRLDPGFARAYAGLADHYANTDALSPAEALPKARLYALKALALDETLGSAHLSLALASMWGDWDWPAAERAFQRAVDLDPGDATTRRWYGLFLDLTGRPQAAFVQLQRVLALDPVSPGTYHALSYHFFLARRYDDALAQVRAVQELNPHDPRVFEGFGTLYLYKQAYGMPSRRASRE